MMQTFKRTAAIAVLGLVSVMPASAATVSVVANAPDSWGSVDPSQSVVVNGTWTAAPSIVAGSVVDGYKSPFDPALANGGVDVVGDDVIDLWQEIQYFTVGSPTPLAASPAIMTFAVKQSYLSLLWGSIDSYNAIAFYLNGVLQDTVDGGYLLANGGEPAANGAAFVQIAESFDEIRFFSNFPAFGEDTAAFEFSNVVAAVPVPAAGFLLIGALGGLAALRRRKTVA
jgi:hypothetical protein